MASPQQSDSPSPGDHAHSAPPVLRLRLVPWDVFVAVTLLATLVFVAIATDWYSGLFGFLTDVCTGDECPPVPFGVDFYIYPLVWGGIGAAGSNPFGSSGFGSSTPNSAASSSTSSNSATGGTIGGAAPTSPTTPPPQ